MAGKSRQDTMEIKKAHIKTLVADAATIGVNNIVSTPGTGTAFTGGLAAVTGTLAVASGLKTIVGVVASLQDDASLTGLFVSATWVGVVITLKVWKPTSNLDNTPLAATVVHNVSWIAIGT